MLPQEHRSYRSDIDGLRTVAVMSVILYHAGVHGLGGGYVGVDIFFVISGYLIGRILVQESTSGRFSIVRFYERRVRRIFPALFTMLLATLAACTVVYLPLDYKFFAQSAAAAASFWANIYFYLRTGYFEPGAEIQPLLHTWSLAVEEQYYLVFPLLVAALGKRSVRLLSHVILGLLIASLAFSIYQVRSNPSGAFFLPWGRMWELLVGAWLATAPRGAKASAGWRQVASLAGWALMLVPILSYTPLTRFPGETALPPVLGAALMIWAGEGTSRPWGNRLLSTAPMVFIGQISYSAYLWHWPIVVLWKYIGFQAPQGMGLLAYLALTLGLAWVSWRWIEAPFRRKQPVLASHRSLFSTAAGAMIVVGAVAVVVHLGTGLPSRLPPETRADAALPFDDNPRRPECDGLPVEAVRDGRLCRLGVPSGVPSFALYGDSIADAFAPGVDAQARELGVTGLSMTFGGCFPLSEIDQLVRPDCRPFEDAVLAHLGEHPEIQTILLVARWTSAALGSRFNDPAETGWFIRDAQSTETSYAENLRVFERSLDRTLSRLADRRIFVYAHFPEQAHNVPRALVGAVRWGFPDEVDVSRSAHEARQSEVRQVLARLQARHPEVRFIDLGQAFCDDQRCPVRSANGQGLYVDEVHIATGPARQRAGLWKDALKASAAVPHPQ